MVNHYERAQQARDRARAFGPPVRQYMPFSEVCMHLGIAGRRMVVVPINGGMVQVYDADGRPLPFPITRGEAGYRD